MGGLEDRVRALRLMLTMLKPRLAGPITADMFYHNLLRHSKVLSRGIAHRIGRQHRARRQLLSQILGKTTIPGNNKGVLRLRLRRRIRVGRADTAILG